MRCPQCGSRSSVVATEPRSEATYRWHRCRACDHAFRSVQQLFTGDMRRRGSEIPSAVLTEADVQRLRGERLAGASRKELQRRYGIGQSQTSDILNNHAWKHVKTTASDSALPDLSPPLRQSPGAAAD